MKRVQHDSPFDANVHPDVYDEAGVDLTLIRWMLGLTPDQRLRVLQDRINTLAELDDARESNPTR